MCFSPQQGSPRRVPPSRVPPSRVPPGGFPQEGSPKQGSPRRVPTCRWRLLSPSGWASGLKEEQLDWDERRLPESETGGERPGDWPPGGDRELHHTGTSANTITCILHSFLHTRYE